MVVKNSKLKNLIKLSSKVTIFIPSTTDVNKPIDESAYIDRAAAELSKLFGGATSTPALGFWLSDSEGLVRERVNLVYSNCTDAQLNEHIESVIEFCETIKAELNQEAIALEINGELYFI